MLYVTFDMMVNKITIAISGLKCSGTEPSWDWNVLYYDGKTIYYHLMYHMTVLFEMMVNKITIRGT